MKLLVGTKNPILALPDAIGDQIAGEDGRGHCYAREHRHPPRLAHEMLRRSELRAPADTQTGWANAGNTTNPSTQSDQVPFAYITGWRVASEVLPLEWRQVDLKADSVRLDVGTTKNGDARVFYLSAALRRVLETRDAERLRLQKAGTIVQPVFFRMIANGRVGELQPEPIGSFK